MSLVARRWHAVGRYPSEIIVSRAVAGGRPYKLTPKIIDAIAAAIRIGAHPMPAAIRAGLSEHTFYKYMAKGRDEHLEAEKRDALADGDIERLSRLMIEEGLEDADVVRFPPPWGSAQHRQIGYVLAQVVPSMPTPEDEPSLYRLFYEAVAKAEADAEVGIVTDLKRLAREDSRAAIALAERRFPRHWARRDKVEVGGPGGGPIELRVDISTDGPARTVDLRPGDAEILDVEFGETVPE